MMKLFSSNLSPYGRKVKLTAAMKGLTSQIEILQTDTSKGDPALAKANPLAKIPCLVLASGETIFDSRVICEYLDATGIGPTLFPRSGPERWRMLTMGSLADGILDAGLLIVYEKRFRPEDKHVATWIERQQAKVDGALAELEKAPPVWSATPDYGHLTVAVALGYLDFRQEGRWRPKHPRLVAWLDKFAATVPAFAATKPS